MRAQSAQAYVMDLPIRQRQVIGGIAIMVLLLAVVIIMSIGQSHADKPNNTPTLIQSNADLQNTQSNTDEETADKAPEAVSPQTQTEHKETENGQAAYRYAIDEDTLEVEAVLVPRDITVISSSRDGRIINIPVRSGDRFQKGDILVEYDCRALAAEAEIASTEKSLTTDKLENAYKLFKLELLSVVDRKTLEVEDQKATARQRLYEARMDDCIIRADFDGRVTNRLANAGEYTRTDRVLLEIASAAPLKADFLIPSTWLRWVNIGAPLAITIQETDETYQARISRIHGEVDPISQSIQVTAQMEPYQAPLLPGMSGQAVINLHDVRAAGITGFLEHRGARP